jgi:shikimate dehydrogenase
MDANTKLYAILGCPIRHSLSPSIHNNWFKETKLNCAYMAFEIKPENLKLHLNALKDLGFLGFNITVPHKNAIIKHIDCLDPIAKVSNSVNTIKIMNNKVYGYNTDYLGLESDFYDKGIEVKNKIVFVYGAGGVSRTVLHMLKKHRAKYVYIANRTKQKAVALAKQFSCICIDLVDTSDVIKNADIIINASACGLNPKDVLPFKVNTLKKGAIIYDLLYNKKAPFIKLAQNKKAKFFTGESMLINQAVAAFKIWTNIEPSKKQAYKIINKHLK